MLLCALFPVLFYCAVIPKRYRAAVESAAEEFGVESELLYAVIRAESGFRADAVSSAGAVGLMQIMPATARFACACMGEELDLFSPQDNIRMGAWYLSYLQKRFPPRRLTLAAYNAGEGTVARWLRDPALQTEGGGLRIPFAETAAYVKRVKKFYQWYNFFYF